MKIAEDQDQALLTKSSLDISLVPESEDDKKLAALMKYSVAECKLLTTILLAEGDGGGGGGLRTRTRLFSPSHP